MDFELMINSFPKLIGAAAITLKLLSVSLIIGLFIGLLFAVLRLNKNIVPIKPLPLDFFLHENEIPTFITRPLNHSILWYLIKNAIVHHCDFESRKKVLRGKML